MSALLAVISTPTSAPLIADTRMDTGPANSARGAARLLADALPPRDAPARPNW